MLELIQVSTGMASPYKSLQVCVKHFFGYLVYEIFLLPESWRGSLYMYLLSFPRFWTLSIERFSFWFWSILNGVTLKTSNRHFCAWVSWKWKGSRHFRLTPGLWIKTRLSAQPLIWKCFFILMQIKLIFTRKASQKVLFFTATFSTPLLTFLISGLESKFIRQQSIEEIGSVT